MKTPELVIPGHIGDLNVLEHFRPGSKTPAEEMAMIFSGGGSLGTILAGGVRPFTKYHLMSRVGFLDALSTSGAVAYFAKTTMRGELTPERERNLLGIYFRDNPAHNILDIRRGNKAINLRTLTQIFESKNEQENFEQLRDQNPFIYIGVSLPNGSVGFIRLEDYKDPIRAFTRAMSAPLLTNYKKAPFFDGSFQVVLPFKHAIDKLGAKSIVAFLADPVEPSAVNTVLYNVVGFAARLLASDYRYWPGQLRGYLRYQVEYQKLLNKYVRNQKGVPVLAFYPETLGRLYAFSLEGPALEQGCYTMADYVDSFLIQVLNSSDSPKIVV